MTTNEISPNRPLDLPMAEESILEIYNAVRDKRAADRKNDAKTFADKSDHMFSPNLLDIASYVLPMLFAGLHYYADMSNPERGLGLIFVSCFVALGCGLLGAFFFEKKSVRGCVGLISFFTHKGLRKEALKLTENKVLPFKDDAYDPMVLETVADYLADIPTRKCTDLVANITSSILDVTSAIKEMEVVKQALDREKNNEDSSYALLLSARSDAALRAVDRLKEQREELQGQLDVAKGLSRPIQRKVEKLREITRIETSMSTIQKTYGIIENVDDSIAIYKATLKSLASVCEDTLNEVANIEKALQANNAARAEVMAG